MVSNPRNAVPADTLKSPVLTLQIPSSLAPTHIVLKSVKGCCTKHHIFSKAALEAKFNERKGEVELAEQDQGNIILCTLGIYGKIKGLLLTRIRQATDGRVENSRKERIG